MIDDDSISGQMHPVLEQILTQILIAGACILLVVSGSANVEELYCGVVVPMNFTVDRSCMHLEITAPFSSALYLCEGYPMKSTIITFINNNLFMKESVSLLSVGSC